MGSPDESKEQFKGDIDFFKGIGVAVLGFILVAVMMSQATSLENYGQVFSAMILGALMTLIGGYLIGKYVQRSKEKKK